MYIARHHVPFAGRVYTPGEVIEEKMSKDVVQRLLALNAIREEEVRVVYVKAESEEIQDTEDGGETESGEDAENTSTTEESEEEFEEDFADADIDVMDGIVLPSEKPEGKNKTSRRK